MSGHHVGLGVCFFFFNGWMKQQPSLKAADLCVMKPFKRTQLKIPFR